MSHHRDEIPGEFEGIAKRLEDERPQATELELDRVKVRAMSAGSRARRGGFASSGRLVSAVVAGVLLLGGGAVIAKNNPPKSASSQSSSSRSQYCPPTSQQPGKPKHPGPARCGKPKTK